MLQLMLYTSVSAVISLSVLRLAINKLKDTTWEQNLVHAEAISRALDLASRRILGTTVDPATTVYSYVRPTSNPADIAALRASIGAGNELVESPVEPARWKYLWGSTGNRVVWFVPEAVMKKRGEFYNTAGDQNGRYALEACGLLPDLDGDGAPDPWTNGEPQCRVSVSTASVRSAGEVRSFRMMSAKKGLYGECLQVGPCTPLPPTTP